jgi:hypothetical protein
VELVFFFLSLFFAFVFCLFSSSAFFFSSSLFLASATFFASTLESTVLAFAADEEAVEDEADELDCAWLTWDCVNDELCGDPATAHPRITKTAATVMLTRVTP